MPFSRPLASLVGLSALALAGCETASFDGLTQSLLQSRTHSREASANALALASMATHAALLQVTAALSEQIARENKDTAELELPQTDLQVTYQLDAAQGSGSLTGKRADKTVLELRFGFSKAGLDGGTAYDVRNVSGKIEGYQVLFPRMQITYSQASDAQGQPLTDADGKRAMRLTVRANGMLGQGETTSIRLQEATLSAQYPFPEVATSIGRFTASSEALRLESELLMGKDAFSAKGAIFAPSRGKLFEVTTAGGKVELKAVP